LRAALANIYTRGAVPPDQSMSRLRLNSSGNDLILGISNNNTNSRNNSEENEGNNNNIYCQTTPSTVAVSDVGGGSGEGEENNNNITTSTTTRYGKIKIWNPYPKRDKIEIYHSLSYHTSSPPNELSLDVSRSALLLPPKWGKIELYQSRSYPLYQSLYYPSTISILFHLTELSLKQQNFNIWG